MIGQTLGHYRIEAKLGEGGMGVVYRALDTHLDRPVAIKVLAATAVADPERKRRFIQEAKTASALNHPGIITIYDIDAANGVDYMAMEYVAGQTLDEKIGRKGLRLGETLKYAVQIADALARAHSAGIVHRDLKPANIMIAEGGLVKVLDFGLAKLTERVENDPLGKTLDAAPPTEEGTLLGTVAYMSPEQAEGRKVDARSDVFSFGAVLYEMLTGRRAFARQGKISTLSAILREEPPAVNEAAPDTPRELERIIARCLRKDPDHRIRDMADLKLLLEELKDDTESGRTQGTQKTRPRIPGILSWAGAAVLVVLAGAAGAWWWVARSRAPVRAPAAGGLTRLTADTGLTTDPVLSPDGKLLAYASDRAGQGDLDIWVQQVAGGEAIRLTRDPADDREPAFSPDGSQIAFRSERDGGGVYLVSALGGEARRVVRQGRRPRHSPDGSQLAYWVGEGVNIPGKVYVVASTGGPPRQVAPNLFTARQPVWSPDGKHLLLAGARVSGDRAGWWVAPIDGAEPQRVTTADAGSIGPGAVPDLWIAKGNRIFFSLASGDARNLWQVTISPRPWQVSEPQRVTSGPGPDVQPSIATGPTGSRLAYSIHAANTDVWSLPMDAATGKVTGPPQRLTQHPAADLRSSISADGKKLAFHSNRSGNLDIWLKDLTTGKETPLTVSPEAESGPKLTRDGSRVAYQSGPDQTGMIVAAGTAGGDPEKLCQPCRLPTGLSSDGKWILWEPPASVHVMLLDAGSGNQVELLKHPQHALGNSTFSPDDRWVSFHTIPGPASRRIFVAPFRGPALIPESEWIPITDGSAMDRYAMWSPDGNLIYFLTERDGFRCISGQRLDSARRPAGAAFEVHHFHHARQSLNFPGDPVAVGFSVARDKLVFAITETTGNIWMSRLD